MKHSKCQIILRVYIYKFIFTIFLSFLQHILSKSALSMTLKNSQNLKHRFNWYFSYIYIYLWKQLYIVGRKHNRNGYESVFFCNSDTLSIYNIPSKLLCKLTLLLLRTHCDEIYVQVVPILKFTMIYSLVNTVYKVNTLSHNNQIIMSIYRSNFAYLYIQCNFPYYQVHSLEDQHLQVAWTSETKEIFILNNTYKAYMYITSGRHLCNFYYKLCNNYIREFEWKILLS